METAGYGLIETLRVRAGRIPFLERHLARLAASTAALGLPRPAQDPASLLRPFAGTEDPVRPPEGGAPGEESVPDERGARRGAARLARWRRGGAGSPDQRAGAALLARGLTV